MLGNESPVAREAVFTPVRSRPYGPVARGLGTRKRRGRPSLLARRSSPERERAGARIVARVRDPGAQRAGARGQAAAPARDTPAGEWGLEAVDEPPPSPRPCLFRPRCVWNLTHRIASPCILWYAR